MQIGKNDIDDVGRCSDNVFCPPRVLLEANARHFTHCSVTINHVRGCAVKPSQPSGDVQGCTFELTEPSGDGIQLMRHDWS